MKFIWPALGILMLGSLAAAIFGLTLPLYTDEPAYQNCYQAISYESGQEQVAAEQFKLCRTTFLTNKIQVIRYSATVFLLAGFALFITSLGGKNMRAPRRKWIVVTTGIMAAFVTCMTYVADLFWNNSLDAFPHWSDSLGIPLAVTPVILVFGLIVWGINLLLIRKRKQPPTEAIFAGSWKRHNKFMLAEIFVAGLLTLEAVVYRDFFSLLPNFVWLTFFLFVMAWRKSPIEQGQ